ncbi:unnamed protein product [Acanthoscelides obtectus]|uniref:Uncharacterized protein n=1 Tax=Acanthoscelides obtectus TaxID=200917 RepID=A0A9P0LWL8_ACAOB|nr:unnamed protein product [Acanthoscelides obtectus]CAK1651383.1 hypothetical protein AOBTE_LOCUS17240 [Acanthoscelides obtectus]
MVLSSWLKSKAPPNVKQIHLIFPVPGHSYIPPDRVFGRIAKVVKKTHTIVKPDGYENILSEFVSVFRLGISVEVADWKTEISNVTKAPAQWHFKFAPCKRILIKKNPTGSIDIQGEASYRSDLGSFKSILKRRKTLNNICPEIIPKGQNINILKLNDCDKLLMKHFRETWRDLPGLQFYINVIDSNNNIHNPSEREEEQCEDEYLDLRV